MIDVLKRLAELDATNPNVDTGLRIVQPEKTVSVAVKESTQVEECGMMPMGGMEKPSTPASINMTAGSGEELSSMIKAIATLAGTAGGSEQVVTGTPTPSDSMRSVLDKLNPMDDQPEEKVDEVLPALATGGAAVGRAAMTGLRAAGKMFGGDSSDDGEKKEAYDNTPTDPADTNEFDAEQHAHHENPPGAAKGRGNMNNPRANTMEELEQSLFADYKKFISESDENIRYAEKLAQKVFDENPNLPTSGRGDEYFNAAWPHMVADLGKKTARYYLNYDEDFSSDTISAYGWLQRNSQKV